MNFIRELICGFQTGADIGAARAAKVVGVPTFGWMPSEFEVEGGDMHPEYAEMYGARAIQPIHSTLSREYRERTRLNVRRVADRSGGILIFDAQPQRSPGTRLVLNTANEINRLGGSSGPTGKVLAPIVVVELYRHHDGYRYRYLSPATVAFMIRKDMNPDGGRVLMVGGNRESSAPGIGVFVESYVMDLFRLLEE